MANACDTPTRGSLHGSKETPHSTTRLAVDSGKSQHDLSVALPEWKIIMHGNASRATSPQDDGGRIGEDLSQQVNLVPGEALGGLRVLLSERGSVRRVGAFDFICMLVRPKNSIWLS